eukprot:19016-Heterococcus_DN1.PRE.1
MAQYCLENNRLFKPRTIYFNNPKEFPEVRELVHSTAQQFGLDLRVYEGSFVKGLQRCMAEMEAETTGATVAETTVGTTTAQQCRTGPLAFGFVLGTRRGDPNCGVQTAFTPSSDWMPPFMRVNPILDWEYGQLPYPSLYDKGYTSLGVVDDTLRNPALRKRGYDGCDDSIITEVGSSSSGSTTSTTASASGSGSGDSDCTADYDDDEYYPAYMLSDWSLERAGRGARPESTLGCELRDLTLSRQRVRDARSAGLIIIGDEILKGKCQLLQQRCSNEVDVSASLAVRFSSALFKDLLVLIRCAYGCDVLTYLQDTNTAFAAKKLWDKGIALGRVATVSDDHAAIAAEVRSQVQAFDVVITSGGVGPTHDDITIYAVASASFTADAAHVLTLVLQHCG